MSSNKAIQDLIFFYVKENYKKHLEEHNINYIPDDKIMDVVGSIYTERKTHLNKFLKDSLKEIQKADYMGDLIVNNICYDIFNDDNVCKHRLYTEIKMYQDTKNKQ